MGGYAWVTLATNDAYSLGALVLAHSLRRVGTKYELAVLITPGVTQTMREKLSTVFSVVMEVNVLDSKDEANLALLARPELGITFTKLHCWRLTQYEKCVFLDADTLVVKNCDELFEREELSAAPDVGWPDCFNSGVFVYKPSQQTFASITAFAAAKGSFDGGDQGLLNMYFSDWARKDISKHLPFIYNMCSTATYSYLPAFKQFGDDVRIIHFIGITKPWLQYFDTLTGIVQPPPGSTHLQPLLQLWWNIFCESVHPQLSPVMATSTLAPIWHEFTPVPFQYPTPRSSTYTDTTDRTQNYIYVQQPDFSEFQDPWENYLTQNNTIIHETEDNVTQQYYSTTNTSSPASTFVNYTHYEPPTEHSRTYYQEQYHESSRIQHNHNQEQSNEYINNETEQQHSCFHPSDTSVSNAQHTWHNQHNVPVYNVQNHHSNESQHQHVGHQYISSTNHYDNNNRLSSEETREHKHVDHQYVYQHSFNNNKSLSEEVIQQQQHNEHYVDDCNHYQTCNSEQSNQHYEKENYNYESVNIKTDHDRSVNGNIAYQNDHLTKRKTVRNKNVNFTDERTKPSISFSPRPNSKPCTDIHKVATQSDPHVMDDLSNPNGGLAGALAQMTLGEPRSAEQIALEEHMRKQSWEQGYIDYMGRDSFDNIWKKICETLALAPPRLPSPPKETEKPAKTATDKTDSIKDDSIKSPDTTQSIKSVDEVDKGAAEATTDSEEQSLVNNVPITSVPKLSEANEQVTDTISSVKKSEDDITQKFSVEPGNETLDANISTQTSNKQILELDTCLLLKETPQQTTAPIASSDPIQSSSIGEQETITETRQLESNVKNVEDLKTTADTEQTKQTDIKDERYAKELCLEESTASEILTVSPVPIQVAESVLQVEPKESMSDSRVAPREALSSTITSVFSVETDNKACVNGSTPSIDPTQSEEKFSSTKAATAKGIDTATELSESLTELKETSQISLPEEIQPQLEETPMSPSGDLKTPEESTQKEDIETVKESKMETGTGTATEGEKTKTLPADKGPVRPTRAKEVVVPSPSASKTVPQDTKGEDKGAKKPVKKSAGKSTPAEEPAEAAEGDGTDKKTEKKVMKKVVKKTKSKSEEGLDDGAEDNNSGSKQKKTVKVVKKSTKSSQPSSTETSVPETPSSSTSDAPVPPKRKTKPTTPKSVTKKSDTQ